MNIAKQKYFNNFLFFTYLLFNISYFIINVKHPIATENPIPIINSWISHSPLIISSLSFLFSTTLLFYIIYTISIKRLDSIFKSSCLLFLLINPFTIKYILIPGDNIIYSLSLFIIFKAYFCLFNKKENNLLVFFLLLLAVCLISPYSIIIISQIVLLDFFYDLFSKKEEKKPLYKLFFIILSVYIIEFNLMFKDIDILSDHISSIYFSFLNLCTSTWLLFIFISSIGFIIWVSYSIKIKTLHFLFYIILFPIACLSFTFNSFNIPFFILILMISFRYIKNISTIYSYGLISILITFSLSSFFSILNNYNMQMIFSENIINNIKYKLNDNETYYVINNISYSPVVRNFSTYPEGYWDRFYLSNNSWSAIAKEKNVFFIKQNQDFIIKKMGMSFYDDHKINNKYYCIMNKNGFSYIFFKKV